MFSPDVDSILRPSDDALSSLERSQVQAHRFLVLLGAVLGGLFIPLYSVNNPGALDPVWIRVSIVGFLLACFVASYLFKSVRHHPAFWSRAAIVGSTGWFVLITALNNFAADYEVGLLMLHAIFSVIAGLSARSIQPVLWFTAGSLAGTVGAVLVGPVTLRAEAALLASMATVSLVVVVVTQRLVAMREEVEEQETQLRGLANSIPGIVYQFYARPDGEWGHHFVSERAEEILGVSSDPEHFLERVRSRIPESHRRQVMESMEEAVAEETAWHVEFPFDTPDGERIWLHGTSTPEERTAEIVYNGFLLDITERKRVEQELRTSKQEAEKASQVKTAMLANMSHEIRTPLTSIVGFSEVLKERLEGELGLFARRTYESSRRLLKTLGSVLQLAKLESGATTLEREEVCLSTVVRDTVCLLESKAEDKSIAIDVAGPAEPVNGQWNESALRRISRNLLENAIKFTPEGGRVMIRIDRVDQEVRLEVEDTGIGIRDESIPDIFQSFQQESEGMPRQYEGSGLGLSIVNHLVTELDGSIHVETEEGRGTCFTVRLPIADRTDALPQREPDPAAAPG